MILVASVWKALVLTAPKYSRLPVLQALLVDEAPGLPGGVCTLVPVVSVPSTAAQKCEDGPKFARYIDLTNTFPS